MESNYSVENTGIESCLCYLSQVVISRWTALVKNLCFTAAWAFSSEEKKNILWSIQFLVSEY